MRFSLNDIFLNKIKGRLAVMLSLCLLSELFLPSQLVTALAAEETIEEVTEPELIEEASEISSEEIVNVTEPELIEEASEDEASEISSEEIVDAAESGDSVTETYPVYDNIDEVDIMGTGSKQKVIGYCYFKADGKAVYCNALSSSASPESNQEITVPRRLVVTSYDGFDVYGEPLTEKRVYDYTDGLYLDEEGYALQWEGGSRRTDSETGEDIYIGEEHFVDELDPDVFKNCSSALRINLPKTIVSDITWEFFVNCKKTSVISMYDRDDDGSRYDTGNSKYENTSGVLVDRDPADEDACSMVIWCPPRYPSNEYKFYIGDYRDPGVIIGPHAFENCVNLKKVGPMTVGTQKVLSIGESAFKGCELLESANVFHDNLREIGDEAFYGCKSLESVKLNATKGDTVIGNRVFVDTAIKTLAIPVGYAQMRGESFVSMNSLSAFELAEDNNEDVNDCFAVSENVLYRLSAKGADFEDGAELVCFPSQKTTSAEDIDASRTVRTTGAFQVPYQVTGFDSHCFYKCANLVTVYFPSTIMDLGTDCFYSCENLGNLYFFSGLPDFSLDSSDYGNTYIFSGCRSNLITIYAGIDTPIYDYAAGCDKSLGIKYEALYDPNCYTFEVSNGLAYLTDIDDDYSELFPNIIVPNYYINGEDRYVVAGIRGAALADTKITSVYFLHDMSDVAQDAFYYIANEDDIEDENNINAVNLENIYVEVGNNSLLSFEGVLYKQEWDEYNEEYYISKMLYYPAGNDSEEYTTVKGLNSLPEYAFWGASALRHLYIYDDIQYIGRIGDTYTTNEPAAFAGCSNLCMVNIISDEEDPTNPNFIEYYSYKGVLYKWDHNAGESGEPVTLIYYPKGDRSMQTEGISQTSYDVADGCTRIKDMKDCKALNTIIIPRSVTTIDSEAFWGCTGLKEVEFKTDGSGMGIRTIGDNAFAYTALMSLTIPETIREIGDRAFYYCVSLTELNIEGDNLISIGDRAFMGDRSLVNVNISCDKSNESGGNAVLGNYCFYRCSCLENFFMNNMGKCTLGDYSIACCTKLSKLDFSDTSIIAIEKGSFLQDSSLTSINLLASTYLEEIGETAFYGCSQLEKAELPSYVKVIGKSAFGNCSSLRNVNFSALFQLETISANAFEGSSFISVTLPSTVKNLGEGVFTDSPLMFTVFVPQNTEFVKDASGEYGDADGPYVNPFADYGKEFYVYGIEGSEAELFIKWMDEHGFKAPTFVGSATMPDANVYMDEAEYTLYDMGETQPVITAVVTSEDDLVDYSVNWICTDDSVIKILEYSGDGKGTNTCRIEGLSMGSAYLYAINPQTGAYAYCKVNVKAASVEVTDTEIKLNTKGSYKTEKISATAYPTRKLYYRSNAKKIAAVSDKGVIKAKREGTTTIVVYAGKDDNYVEKEINVTVYKPTLKLDKSRLKLCDKGSGDMVSANVAVSHYGAYDTVSWYSSNSRVAYVEGDNEGAVVYALKPGKCTITAECNGLKKKLSVTVVQSTVNLNTQAVTLYYSENSAESYKLTTKTTGLDKNITYSSSNENVAVADQNGRITATGEGTAVITAAANGTSATCKVTVKECSIKLYQARGDSVNEKTSIVVNSRGDNTYSLMAKVIGRNSKVTWTSTAKSVFTVDSSGTVTGKSGGTADLIATANGISAYCSVTVIDTFTELDYSDMVLYLDGDDSERVETCTVTIEGADTDRQLTWEVEDDSVITLDKSSDTASYNVTEYGGSGMATITAKKKGKTRFRVTANGVAAYCTVTVK